MLEVLRFLAVFSCLLGSHAFQEQQAGERRTNGPSRHDKCKASPGSPLWPSDKIWSNFNQSVEGRLIGVIPPGAVCHQGQLTFDEDKCAIVQESWHLFNFHVSSPISNMWNQFNNDTCLPNADAPCSAAGYPAYAVNCTTPEHVRKTLRFAAKNNVRVVVKSSGHDFQGRSTAPGAITIWVHYLNTIETLKDFQPKGCSFVIPGPAATVGGGTQMIALQPALDKIGQVAVGGGGETVSVGGYITGGGHSILAPRYGLAADQVLEMEIVTPQGDIVTANECQNKDLFWAARGGGGSTFGVVTSFTIATHPTPQIVNADIVLYTPLIGVSWFYDIVGYVVSQFDYLDSKGASGYSFTISNFTTPGNASIPPISIMICSFILQDTQNTEDMVAVWKPILDYIDRTWPQNMQSNTYKAYPSFLKYWNEHHDDDSAGADMYVGSHLLDAKSIENATAVAQAYREAGELIGGASAFLVAGRGVREAKPRGGSNGVGSSWRKALIHATTGINFPPLNIETREQSLQLLNYGTDGLRKLAPHMGAYVNENNPAEPNWQKTFWGDNYERLSKIKHAIDPEDVLWCHPCVGNERWEEVGYQLCRK